MASRFEHLYKRDSSVSMIRVKMARRRSQSQKEGREKMQNIRRHLDQLAELELSVDVPTLDKSAVPSHEPGRQAKADKKNSAAEERKKMLARFKENKALQKEKEKREKEKKATFKVGLYRPQPLGYLPLNLVVPTAKKTTEPLQSTRVTRSMKQALQPKQPAEKKPALKAEPLTRANKSSTPAISIGRIALVEPVVRAPTTRSAAKALTASVMGKSVAKPAEDLRPHKTKAANRQPAATPSGRGKAMPAGRAESVAAEKKERKVAEDMVTAVNPSSKEEKMAADTVTPVSFAPQGFVFQAPTGLLTFQPSPLSPRSAEAFLSPSFSAETGMETKNLISPPSDSFLAPPLPLAQPCMSKSYPASVSTPATSSSVPVDSSASLSRLSCASPAPDSASISAISFPAPASIDNPHCVSPASTPLPSPPASSPSFATSEPQHDVPYFRAIMASETERLTGLSEFWELRFDDSAIPEELQDRMRTAVGQARLLMKERFGQFSGLVDDCQFGRGEKITTCTDLQGFWEMVYFQVEDVKKKFNALKEAEARGWQEEIKPVTKQKKVVKKPPAAGGKTGAGAGANAGAKSRLAAVKAAMKAKQAATKAAEASDKAQGDAAPASAVPANILPDQSVVFHGGFFQVESPVKVIGAVRRSSRLSAAPSTQCSPHGAKFSTPGRQKRSAIVGHSSLYPCVTPSKNPLPIASPAAVNRTSALPICTPKHYTAPCASPNGVSCTQLDTQSDLRITSVDDQMNQSAALKPHNSPCQTEELPFHLPAPSTNSTEPEGSSQDYSMTALSQEQPEETVIAEVNMCHSDSQNHSMSFSDSPSELRPLAVSDKVDVCVNERSPIRADCKGAENESIAGFDFERYLQPTPRRSLSPVQSMAVERYSLGLEDAEMESPQAQTEKPVHDALITPTAFPRMAPLVVTPWTEEVISNQLLFTPEQRERVRPSVCERDLMMFTPPCDL